jgi:hypothetical protein
MYWILGIKFKFVFTLLSLFALFLSTLEAILIDGVREPTLDEEKLNVGKPNSQEIKEDELNGELEWVQG